MSPRAACRLEAIGFENVYDYSLGIADWKAAGLPLEGNAARSQVVADATRSDIPVAAPAELLGAVLDRASSEGWEEALVLDCEGVLVGRLRGAVWDQDRDVPVERVMELGPTTVRPDSQLAPLVERMQARDTKLVTVTSAQGVLIGALLRVDAERVLTGESVNQIWAACDGCPGHWSTQ